MVVRGVASEYSWGEEAPEQRTFSIVDGVGEDMRGKSMRGFPVVACLICVIAFGRLPLNSLIASSAVSCSASSHWLSESGYPTHLTRYCTLRLRPRTLESRICSTSYSSSLLIRSGGGLV